MDSTANHDVIGLGVYTLQEGALYGRLSPQKLSRWVFGTSEYPPVIDSQLLDEHLDSFYDLVQAMAVDRARSAGVSLQKIREAIARARDTYDVELPLAHRHKLMLFDKELLIQLPNRNLVQLTGRGHDQTMMRPIVEPFLKDLQFGPEGLVVKYTPFEWAGRRIILDPKRQFGQPLVGNTGCRAVALADAVAAGDSIELVAHAYEVETQDVLAAIKYMESLRKAA